MRVRHKTSGVLMAMLEFTALAQQCARAVHPTTMAAVVRVESTFNPFAIGVVGGRLERQPSNKAEAIATAKALDVAGYDFSVGIGQVNRRNLSRYGLDYERAFEPCANLNAASRILKDCFERARASGLRNVHALGAAFSCYYSGDFSTGFRGGINGQPSYVQRVFDSAAALTVTQPHIAPRSASGTGTKVIRKVLATDAPLGPHVLQAEPPYVTTVNPPDGGVMVYH